METYRAQAIATRSKDSVARELKRFVRRTAPRKSQREAAIAMAATVPLTEKQAAALMLARAQ